jgi:protein FRA10AC1
MSPRTFASVDADLRRERIKALLRLSPEERHRVFLDDYDRFYGVGAAAAAARAGVIRAPVADDMSTVRSTFRFLRSDEDDNELSAWEARLARRYYDKLFKEYCVADLSRYRERKIGLRWRTASEVKSGKGQFFCGEKKCHNTTDLASYEVHFGYVEAGEKKEALVKLRACPGCARKLVDGRGGDAPRRAEETRNEEARPEDRRGKKRVERRGKKRTRRGTARSSAHRGDGMGMEEEDEGTDGVTGVTEKAEERVPEETEDHQHRRCFTNMFA